MMNDFVECHPACCAKTRMVSLPDCEKMDDMYSHFDRIPACDRQTDRQTDGRTSCDGIVRVMHSIER